MATDHKSWTGTQKSRVLFVLVLIFGGCNSAETPTASTANRESTVDQRGSTSRDGTTPPKPGSMTARKRANASTDPLRDAARRPNRRRTLADLLLDESSQPDDPSGDLSPYKASLPDVDDGRVQLAGIRIISGKHLKLYTDLPPSPDVDELAKVVDLAVPQLCEYFGLPISRVAKWRLIGSIIKDKALFRSVGLLPDNLPPFLHGYHRGREIWVYEQPSAYYRRHLLLHELTHAFMWSMLGGAGPPWYMEGMAELLGTHRWDGETLTIRHFPRNKDEVPYWGRIKIVRDEFLAHRGMMLDTVLRYDPQAHRQLVPYGWCWAAAAFLDNHPNYKSAFRALQKYVRMSEIEFNGRFELLVKDQLRELDEQWQLFVVNMEYGYDLERSTVEYKLGEPLPRGGSTVEIDASRGWQSSGVRVQAGQSYRISAKGRYQIAKSPEVWWCEPGGVTIRYHRGLPLGILVAAIRLDEPQPGLANLTRPMRIGLLSALTPKQSGTLYLRINDSPAELEDNQGSLDVTISAN